MVWDIDEEYDRSIQSFVRSEYAVLPELGEAFLCLPGPSEGAYMLTDREPRLLLRAGLDQILNHHRRAPATGKRDLEQTSLRFWSIPTR